VSKIAIFQRGETFVHRVTIKNRSNQLVDTDWKLIDISDPCDLALVSTGSMTRDSKGVYVYNYDIASSATYGKYKSAVSFSNSGGNIGKDVDEFYVMPWDASTEVRQISGISSKKDISDKDLDNIVWMAYQRALREVYAHHSNEIPLGNPDTGVAFNGTNTSFQTRHTPIADFNGDGNIYGYGQNGKRSCGTDVNFWYKNNAGSFNQGKVTVNNATNGELTITTTADAAIPSSQEGVYLDYYSESPSFNNYIFQQAVSFLASHYVEQRFKTSDRVTMADLNRNNVVMVANQNRFFYEYKRLLNLIRRPMIGGV